jgi:lipid-A-disaccharide synthase
MELRKRGHSVSLWLLPCQFASGAERMAASRLGVDKLEGPSGSAWMWHALGQEKTDCVLQLGGDLLFGRRIAGCAGAPLICYAYGFKKGMERARVFTAYPSMSAAIGARSKAVNARPVGDLVKDSLALETGTFAWPAPQGEKSAAARRLLLFPGSRPAILRLSLGWLSAIARHLKTLIPQVLIGTLFSPFAPEDEFSSWVDAGLNPIRAGAGAAMRSADYALTQPGTNTLEMMHCGLPALVAAPMDFLKVIPVGGLGGFASRLPLIGPSIKERGIRRNLKRYNDFIAWPNRIANRALLDEAVGEVVPEELAVRIAEALRDGEKLSRVRRDLLLLSGERGAALRLCDAVEEAGKRRLDPQ